MSGVAVSLNLFVKISSGSLAFDSFTNKGLGLVLFVSYFPNLMHSLIELSLTFGFVGFRAVTADSVSLFSLSCLLFPLRIPLDRRPQH